MVKYKHPQLNSTFSALSDSTRRDILSRLTRGTATVTELAEPFKMSLPAISKHLKVLENAGLLTRTKEGRIHRLQLEAKPMREAAEWVNHYQKFWDAQLDNLADYLETLDQKERTE